MNCFIRLLLASLLAMTLAPVVAQNKTAEKTAGRIVKIDSDRAKVTLAHSRINSINMAAMTMPFKVRDASLLTALKVGDAVLFSVVVIDGELVITQLEVSDQREGRP